jgi:integrase
VDRSHLSHPGLEKSAIAAAGLPQRTPRLGSERNHREAYQRNVRRFRRPSVGNSFTRTSQSLLVYPVPPVTKRPFLRPVQAKAFLTYLIGHRHEALLTVALTMRLRRGEILASRWCDLDLEKTQLLKVLHSRERVKHSRSPSQKHESEARPPASPTLASRL